MPDIVNPDAPEAPEATDSTGTAIPAPEFYCPGCGRRWRLPLECHGKSAAAPHPPIQTVSTAELDGVEPGGGDPDKLTHAPSTENPTSDG